MPGGLKKLDDKVLGSRGKAPAKDGQARGDGAHDDAPDGRPDGAHDDVYPEERTERTTRTTDRAESKGNGDGVSSFLAVFWRIAKLVLFALGLVVLTAAALVLLPANDDNVIVRNVLSLAETVAGPFKDILTVDDPDRMRIYNYGIAATVYFVLGAVVGKLPTGSSRKT
jgi:hypothetical protein